MADSIFGNLPQRRGRDSERASDAFNRGFREAIGMYQPEGPLPPRPELSSRKGGPSINQGTPSKPVTSVWSAADAAANGMTLSNGGLTVTPSGVFGNQAIRGSVSHNTGKWYVEFLNTASGANAAMMFGFADVTFSAGNNYLGSNGVSVGVQLAGASYTTSGFTASNIPVTSPTINEVWMLAIDLTAGQAWLGQNNGWFNAGNPASGTVPLITISAPALGVALFPGMTFYGSAQGVWTLQATAASQKYAPPAGFSPWN